MVTHRLRLGDVVTLAGAALLLFALFAPWYRVVLPPEFAEAFRSAVTGSTDPFARAFGEAFAAQAEQATRGGLTVSAWEAFKILDVVLLAAAAGAALLLGLSITDRLSRPVDDLVAAAGSLAVGGVLFRIIVRPGPNEVLTIGYGAWMALAGAVAIVAGSRFSARETGAGQVT
jgi:hypothetical protein